MILTCLKKYNFVWYIVLLGLSVYPQLVLAQSSGNTLSLSVTPTLFEMSAVPQQAWNSNVKVINNNPYPLTVYASVVNFAPQGETGQGKLLPVFEESTEGATLAEWITITHEAVEIPPESSKQIPFSVYVPEDAAPGGHFAAIMVGTRPPDPDAGFRIKTSQIVTSLFFVRVAGDVIEDGQIREFKTTDKFLSEPIVNFELRFQNKGNVHIQPQGEILIKNMWGKERGVIPINHQTHFGNVLPESIRKFEFTWRGELSFSDVGRYSAELTLAYGNDLRQFLTATTYFWVIPVKPMLTVLGIIVAIILFLIWIVKAYVRRMLALEGYQPHPTNRRQLQREGDVLIERRRNIDAPVRAGWFDLTSRLEKTKAFVDTFKVLLKFAWQYKRFFFALFVLILIFVLMYIFFASVTQTARDYEVVIDNPDAEVVLSSEQIMYDKMQSSDVLHDSLESPAASSSQPYDIVIVNSSRTPGAAAQLQSVLKDKYQIKELRSDFGQEKERSIMIYHPSLQEEVLALRSVVGDFSLSALPPEDEDHEIIIYIGNDYDMP